jgi:hypothetical protein
MTKSTYRILVIVVAAALCVGAAYAATNGPGPQTGMKVKALGAVTVGGGWQGFNWSGAAPVDSSDNPFTFTLAAPGYLTVIDCFYDGDQFEVRNGTTLLGTTSVPANNHQTYTDPNVCAAFPAWSSGSFPLAAGTYSINIRVIAEATGFTSGTGYLRVDNTQYPLANPIPVLGWVGLGALALALGAAAIFVLRRV